MTEESSNFIQAPNQVTILPGDTNNESNVTTYEFQLEQNDSQNRKTNLKAFLICLAIFLLASVGIALFSYRDRLFTKPDEINEITLAEHLCTIENLNKSENFSKIISTTQKISTTPPTIINEDVDYKDDSSEITPIVQKTSNYSTHSNFNKFPSDCGPQKSKQRIQYGKDAELFEHPWIVALFLYNETSDTETYYCGGSLVSDKIILTAAHCFVNLEGTEMRVRLGEFNMTTEIDCQFYPDLKKCKCSNKPQNFKASDFTFVVHEKYSNVTGENDIALIKLLKPAKLSLSVAPVCLPFYDNEVPKKMEIIGFGKTFEFKKNSEILKKGFVDLYNQTQCAADYKNTRILTNRQFCANKRIEVKNKTTTIDTCRGDSGSPAIGFLDKVTQFGITSWGQSGRCGVIKKPGVFIKVPAYMDWILDNSG